MTDRIPVLRGLVLLLVVGSLLTACSNDGGPDLIAAMRAVPGRTSAPASAASGIDSSSGSATGTSSGSGTATGTSSGSATGTGSTSGSEVGTDPLDGASSSRRYYFSGDVDSVARRIRREAGDPAESITQGGVVHYLYRSGTVIVADIGGTTGVGLVDNRRARRSRPFLSNSSGWNRQVNDFGSSGNGFRGGGSGVGK